MSDRTLAADWARRMLAQPDAIILDTETTGLYGDAEIVQIGILSMDGQVLLDTLVRPTGYIPRDATRVHHIADADVANAPTIADLLPQLREIIGGATVAIFNADFDTRILEQSLRALGLPVDLPVLGAADYECAMHWYSQWVGEWSDYHGDYRWQRLPGGDHTAIGDCRATLAVLMRMAESAVNTKEQEE